MESENIENSTKHYEIALFLSCKNIFPQLYVRLINYNVYKSMFVRANYWKIMIAESSLVLF